MSAQNPFTQNPAVLVKAAVNPMGTYSPPKGYRPTDNFKPKSKHKTDYMSALKDGSLWDAYVDSAKSINDRFYGMFTPALAVEGLDLVAKGSRKYFTSTPLANPHTTSIDSQGNQTHSGWDPAGMAKGVGQMGWGSFQTLLAARGGKTPGVTAFNPVALLNKSPLRAKAPKFLQGWARRADDSLTGFQWSKPIQSLKQLPGNLTKSIKNWNTADFWKNRGAVLGSSLLGPANQRFLNSGEQDINTVEQGYSNPLNPFTAKLINFAQESPYLLSKGFIGPGAVDAGLNKLNQVYNDNNELYTGWLHNVLGNARQSATTPTTDPRDAILASALPHIENLSPAERAAISNAASRAGFLNSTQHQGGRWLAPGATPYTTQDPEQASRELWSAVRDYQNRIQQAGQPQTASSPTPSSNNTTQPKLSSWGTEVLMKIINWLQQTGQSLESLFARK